MALVGNVYGASPFHIEAPEAASQDFMRGEFVITDADGRIAEAAIIGAEGTDDSIDLAPLLLATDAGLPIKLLGIAAEDASGTTGANVHVEVLRSGDILEMNLIQALKGDAANITDHTLATTDLFAAVNLVRDFTAGYKRYYATTSVTEAIGKILKIGLGGGRGIITDVNARVHVVLRDDILFTAGGQGAIT